MATFFFHEETLPPDDAGRPAPGPQGAGTRFVDSAGAERPPAGIMTAILLMLVSVPALWLLGLLFYLLSWFDWDRKHSYISK
jgi:hypothetical protein